uniref:Uncharacterized protein n=1 Tax=Pseudomonas phage RVTF4 TaxID=3236931 RepID=A0AB39CD88_9VIRU
MSSAYSEPVNTSEKLYIGYGHDTFNFDDLFMQISAHFGQDSRINEFTIELEYLQIDGCSCCRDNTYRNYLVVSRREQPWPDCNSSTLRVMLEA